MMARHDHQALLMGSVLSRIDRFEDEELCWQRIDSLTLHRNFRFDWHTHTSSIENAGPQQVHGEYLAGIWQVFGIGSGPYFCNWAPMRATCSALPSGARKPANTC